MKRIGVLGGGQLGRMLALAGYRLGLQFAFYDPEPTCCAKELAPTTHASYDDKAALTSFAQSVDMITFETENIPVNALLLCESQCPVFPSVEALAITQDRLLEKEYLKRHGIPTAPFMAIDHESDWQSAIETLGFPFVVKTRRHGYDGKGQWWITGKDDLARLPQNLPAQGIIAEKCMTFRREFSMIAVQNRALEICFYDLCENDHEAGILRVTHNKPKDAAHSHAETIMRTLLTALQYCGVMTVEFFEATDGEILVNEIAPRVHNSGHWTIEGAVCCQFENHLRAGLGWSLGNPSSLGLYRMENIIGDLVEPANFNESHAWLHQYGKNARPGRKLGHRTFLLGK